MPRLSRVPLAARAAQDRRPQGTALVARTTGTAELSPEQSAAVVNMAD